MKKAFYQSVLLYALLKNSSCEFIFSAGGALCARPCGAPAALPTSSGSAGDGSCDASFISYALIYKKMLDIFNYFSCFCLCRKYTFYKCVIYAQASAFQTR